MSVLRDRIPPPDERLPAPSGINPEIARIVRRAIRADIDPRRVLAALGLPLTILDQMILLAGDPVDGQQACTPARVTEPAPARRIIATSIDREVSSAPGAQPCVVLRVFGELDLVSSQRFERAIVAELLAGNDLVLDLSAVGFIDSRGLHAMREGARTAKTRGRRLAVNADLPRQAQRLMELVGLLPLVSPCDVPETDPA